MSIELTKRIAADILNRGISSIKITEKGLPEAKKAITREDVKKLIKDGLIYADAIKHNKSRYGKELKIKRAQGRRRGTGSKKGTKKARGGIEHKKRIRALRRILLALKKDKTINNERFKAFYKLAKGGTFQNKATMLSHIKESGINIDDEKYKKLKHM
ncbi:MAG: 50S ribosomal protein L19e [Candidatus Micrarchaeia archaeon]